MKGQIPGLQLFTVSEKWIAARKTPCRPVTAALGRPLLAASSQWRLSCGTTQLPTVQSSVSTASETASCWRGAAVSPALICLPFHPEPDGAHRRLRRRWPRQFIFLKNPISVSFSNYGLCNISIYHHTPGSSQEKLGLG